MAIAWVQTNSARSTTATTTVAAAYTAAQTAGNCNVVGVGFGNNSSTITSVTDTSGNTYVQVSPASGIERTTGSPGNSQAIYVALNIKAAAAGANTVTVLLNVSTAFPDVRILEYSGVATSGALHVQNSVHGGPLPASPNNNTSVSVTTTNANCLLVGSTTVSASSTGVVGGTGTWTLRVNVNTTNSTEEDQVVSTPGPYTSTTVASVGSTYAASLIALIAPDATAPTTPTGLAVAGTPTSSTIPLTWNSSTDPDNPSSALTYTLQRTGGAGTVLIQNIPGVVSGSINYTDSSGLSQGTTYNYTVKAIDPAGNQSAFSSPSVPATTAGAAVPAFVQAFGPGTQPVAPAVTVTVPVTGQTAGNCNVVFVGWSDNTSSVASVSDGTNTYSQVGTTASGGSPVNSQGVYVLPAIPGGNQTITVTWNARPISPDVRVVELSGIQSTTPTDVFASGVSVSNTTTAATAAFTTTNANDALVAGVMCSTSCDAVAPYLRAIRTNPFTNLAEYQIVSTIQTGVTATATLGSPGSWIIQMVSLKAGGAGPSAPVLSLGSSTPTTITLSWTAASEPPLNPATFVYLVEKQISGTFTQIAQTAAGATSYQDTGLFEGTQYSYQVRAQDANLVKGAYSNVLSPTTPTGGTAVPGPAQNVQATVLSNSSIRLDWQTATDLDNSANQLSYTIQRTPAFVPSNPTTSPGALTYTDTALQSLTQYSYQLVTVDPDNHQSAPTAPVTKTTAAAGSPPTFIQAADSFPAYPVSLSPTSAHRWIQDVNGEPFFMVGESAQALIVKAATTDIRNSYFPTRVSQGFNTLWVNLISNNYTGGVADGTIQDGVNNNVAPFTTSLGNDGNGRMMYDLSTPNPTYFAKADQVMQAARDFGILVFLNPIDTGGWLFSLRNATNSTHLNSYGQFVAQRYGAFPNIIWYFGNDFLQGALPAAGGQDDLNLQAVRTGIFGVDSTHLNTIELNYNVSTSFDLTSWRTLIDLDGIYTYYIAYDEALKAYGQSPLPVFLQETFYDGETGFGPNASTNAVPRYLRKQAWWAATSGCPGQHYGSTVTYRYAAGWQNNLSTQSMQEVTFWGNLFNSFQWWLLVPDTTGTFVPGRGTQPTGAISPNANDYVTAAITSDKKVGVVYVPALSTITVAMTSFVTGTNNVQVRWYDPTNGTYRAILEAGSPFNGGTGGSSPTFASPSANFRGDPDWVLVCNTV